MSVKSKSFFTSHPENDREKKNLLFLNLIKTRKAISRTEISKLTDINIVTVSNYVNNYLKHGLVLEGGYEVSSGGRRPELVELNENWGVLAGLEIAAEHIIGVLVTLRGQTLASSSFGDFGEKKLKFLIDEILEKLLTSAKLDKNHIRKIGVSVSAENLLSEIIKIKDDIETDLSAPVLFGRIALCAAFGEKSANPEAKDVRNILYAHEDIGEAVFIKDEEFYEASEEKEGYAYLRPWNRNMGIVDETRRMAEENDEIAMDLIRASGVNLGVRIAYLVNLFEPECVIIGGEIEKTGKLFFEPLKISVNRFVLERLSDKARIVPGTVGEEASAKGAAFLAMREVFIEA